MKLYTARDIQYLTDIPPATLSRWCDDGIVVPFSGGEGTGNHRQWTRMQMIGFIVAEEVRNSERSCALKYVGDTIAAFGAVTEDWLKNEFANQRTHFVRPHRGRPLLSGDDKKQYGWVNALAAYNLVLLDAAKKGR